MKSLFLFAYVFCFNSIILLAQNPSAIVEFESTDKGVLIPRMTESDKNMITNPANGLLIFQTNTDIGFHYYSGSEWVYIKESSNLSDILDNSNDAGGNPISNLADPINPQDAATKAYIDNLIPDTTVWNSLNNNLYYDTGNVGIGLTDPLSSLHIDGSITLGDDGDLTPPPGTIRWNSISKEFEGFDGNIWRSLHDGDILLQSSQEDKMTASDGDVDDEFGYSISIDGDYAVVGSPFNDDDGSNSGAAYVFMRTGSNWTEQQVLIASNANGGDRFGYSVDIDGDYIVVGAPENNELAPNAGSAYVFLRSGPSWSEQAKLTASDGSDGDKFGTSVCILDSIVAIGALLGDYPGGYNKGTAYTFTRSGTTWTEQEEIYGISVSNSDFGQSIDIDTNRIVVGGAGIYIFHWDGMNWIEEFAVGGIPEFGHSVAIDGDNAVSGFYKAGFNGISNSGAVYAYTYDGADWTQEAIITISDAESGDFFGYSVDLDGSYLIASCHRDDDDGFNSGSAYFFVKSGFNWFPIKLNGNDTDVEDYFGISVAISGNIITIGSTQDDDNGSNSGSVYSFIVE